MLYTLNLLLLLSHFIGALAWADNLASPMSAYCTKYDLKTVCVRLSSDEQARVNQCNLSKKANQCDELGKANPSLKDKIIDCTEHSLCPAPPMNASDFGKICLTAWKDSWRDSISGTLQFLFEGMSLPKAIQDRERFFQQCQTAFCKRQMLGPFVSMFKKEEIEGVADKSHLNPNDPNDANMYYGYSAEILYRKLLQKLKAELPKHSMQEPFIQPWDGKAAQLPRSLNEMIDDSLAKMGITHSACFDPAAETEMRCYAFFSIVDPTLLLAGAAKLPGIAGKLAAMAKGASRLKKAEEAAGKAAEETAGKAADGAVVAARSSATEARLSSKYSTKEIQSLDKNLQTHRKVYLQAKANGNPQIKFLEKMGADFSGPSIRLDPEVVGNNIVKEIDDMVASGKISQSDALYPARIFQDKNGNIIAVKFGDRVPDGLEPYRGLLSSTDFSKVLSEGKFPIGEPSKYTNGGQSEFMHDLGHFGSFVDDPNYMASISQANKKAAQQQFSIFDINRKKTFDQRMFESFETLSLAPTSQRPQIVSFMKDLHVYPDTEARAHVAVQAANTEDFTKLLNKMTDSQLNKVIDGINKNAVRFTNDVGGAQRDLVIRADLKDKDYFIGNNNAKNWKTNPSGFAEDVGNLKAMDDFRQYKIAVISKYLSSLDYSSQITPADWLAETTTAYGIANDSKVYQYVCKSGVFSKGDYYFTLYCLN